MRGHTPHSLESISKYLVSQGAVMHYTCNSPSVEVLKKHKVAQMGVTYGCADDREVLLIPTNLYKARGHNPEFPTDKATLRLWSEQLLTALGREQ